MQLANFMQLRAGCSPAHLSGSSIMSTGIPLGPVGFGGLQQDRPGLYCKLACALAVACRGAPCTCCAACSVQSLQRSGRWRCAATNLPATAGHFSSGQRHGSDASCFQDCYVMQRLCERKDSKPITTVRSLNGHVGQAPAYVSLSILQPDDCSINKLQHRRGKLSALNMAAAEVMQLTRPDGPCPCLCHLPAGRACHRQRLGRHLHTGRAVHSAAWQSEDRRQDASSMQLR